MALTIDAGSVLRGIAAHPDVFDAIAADLKKTALALAEKQIRGSDVARLRAVHKVLGGSDFALVVDAMSAAAVKACVTKLDKHHPDLTYSTDPWRRQQLCRLAAGEADPSPAPAKSPAATKKSTRGAGAKTPAKAGPVKSKAMGATRKT